MVMPPIHLSTCLVCRRDDDRDSAISSLHSADFALSDLDAQDRTSDYGTLDGQSLSISSTPSTDSGPGLDQPTASDSHALSLPLSELSSLSSSLGKKGYSWTDLKTAIMTLNSEKKAINQNNIMTLLVLNPLSDNQSASSLRSNPASSTPASSTAKQQVELRSVVIDGSNVAME